MSSAEIIEKLKEVSKHRFIRWDLHECSICGCPVGYEFHEGRAFFDSMCDCTSFFHEPDQRSWESVQDTIERNLGHDIVNNLIELIGKEGI